MRSTPSRRFAHEQGADFREVVLLDEKAESIARFERRRDDSAWDKHNRRLVALEGGPVMLAAMYNRLLEVLRLRPSAVVVRSEPEAVEQTYASLTRVLQSRHPRRDRETGRPTETSPEAPAPTGS